MSELRIIIVDFNHLAHMHANSGNNLTYTVYDSMGNPNVINTTIINGVVKSINRWSNQGMYPIAICFDSPVPSRKAFFCKAFNVEPGSAAEYKGGRERMSEMFYDSIERIQTLFNHVGISCFKSRNYEADDLIFACIKKAKEDYPGVPIDVITNDADLIPLVDDTVSVFIRSKIGTYAVRKDLEKMKYIQVTPDNYQEVVQNMSNYRKFLVPYNTLLLQKIIRGDSSDNIPGIKKKFPPKVYNRLIEDMQHDWVDLYDAFRYGECKKSYRLLDTKEEVSKEFAMENKSKCFIKYDRPKELDRILEVMSRYTDDSEVLDYIEKMYLTMNLNQAYLGLGEASRQPAEISRKITGYDDTKLASLASSMYGVRLYGR